MGGSGVEGAFDCQSTAVENVSVDHGRLDILVPEQFLDGANIIVGPSQCRSFRCVRSNGDWGGHRWTDRATFWISPLMGRGGATMNLGRLACRLYARRLLIFEGWASILLRPTWIAQ